MLVKLGTGKFKKNRQLSRLAGSEIKFDRMALFSHCQKTCKIRKIKLGMKLYCAIIQCDHSICLNRQIFISTSRKKGNKIDLLEVRSIFQAAVLHKAIPTTLRSPPSYCRSMTRVGWISMLVALMHGLDWS